MFHDLTDGPLPYEAPWEQEPLATRLAAVRDGRPRVVWLCERPDTSTFRYRCLNPVATPTFAFRHAIRDGVTGRLARAHEWDAALAEAVSLVRDPARYAPIAEAVAAEAYVAYGWNQQARRILDAVRLG